MANEPSLKLPLRSQRLVRYSRGYNVWDEDTVVGELPANRTAMLICDMWDKYPSS